MVRRQEEERHGEARHGIERSNDNLAVKMVRVEHVAAHHHERATHDLCQLGNFFNRLEASFRVASLSLGRQEVPGHP